MLLLQVFLIVVPALLLLSAALLPSAWADRGRHQVRLVVRWLAALQVGGALVAAGLLVSRLAAGSGAPLQFRWPAESPVALSVYFDGLTAAMLLLVALVGWVVASYSLRYLDGERRQGRYFRWVSFTIGAVSLLIISGNLALLAIGWVATSLGLHRLLLHYPERPGARRAAGLKFLVSRLGDVLLLAALGLIYRQWGTWELGELLVLAPQTAPSATTSAIGWLLMLAAVTKSVQFPFHVWLPETMETPTPVSALMHAGIVNAGGFLIIRLGPLVAAAPAALATLATIGTVTICFAGLVMLTQTNVKRTLAYSTIAQMGFMMLQCGLGAFSAALLHILAHSLYKAYAFLNSGNVLDEVRQTAGADSLGDRPLRLPTLLVAGGLAAASLVIATGVWGVKLADKPGGIALPLALGVALAAWLWDVFRVADWRVGLIGLVAAPVLAVLYLTGFFGAQALLGPVAAALPAEAAGLLAWVGLVNVTLCFGMLLAVQWLLSSGGGRAWLAPLQIHAANGFYVDAVVRRLARGPR